MAAKQMGGWYGVRTLFRLVAMGEPKFHEESDGDLDPDSTLIEDRVVLFQAGSFDDAIRKGEAEALRYAGRTRYENIYGQRVRMKFLGAAQAFHISADEIAAECEVFSSSTLVDRAVNNAQLIRARLPGRQPGQQARLKFLDAGIVRRAMAHRKKTPLT